FMFDDGFLGQNWQASFDFMHLESRDQPYWTNIRVIPAATRAPDGRILYRWRFDSTLGAPDPVTGTTLTGSDIGIGSANGGTGDFYILAVQKKWLDTGAGDLTANFSYTHSHLTDISPSTSSTASSNYSNRASINYNEPEVGTSDYERRHRATVQLNW